MATISNPYDPNKDDDKDQDSAAPAVSSAPSGPTAPPSGGSSAAPTVDNSSATPKASSSGRFQNIQSYVNANSGYNQGKGLAGQVGDNLQNQASGIQSQFDKAQTDYNKQVQDNTINYDQGAVDSAISNAGNLTPDQLSSFQKFSNATYGGPTQLAQADQLQAQAGTIANMADSTKIQTGRTGLLQQLYGGSLNGGYNQGQQSLDQLLLQGSPGQLAALQNQTIPLAKNLQSTIGAGITADQAAAAQAAATNASTAQQARGALGGALTGFDTDAAKSVVDAKAKTEKDFSALQNRLSSGTLTPADYQMMGIQAGDQTYGTNPLEYLHGNGMTATEQNVLSPEQAARISGLSKLAGTGFTGAGSDVLGKFSDLSQAGKYSGTPVFDQTAFRAGAANLKNQDQQTYKNLLRSVANTVNGVQSTSGPANYNAIGQTSLQSTGNIEGDLAAVQKLANSSPYEAGRPGTVNTLQTLQDLVNRSKYHV